MALRTRWTALVLAVGLAAVGCKSIAPQPRSPLQPTQMTPQTMVLEILFVRFPLGDPQANSDLWKEVDEQRFTPELRWRLTRNGLRAGVIGGHLPAALAHLLELRDKPPAKDAPAQAHLPELTADAKVTGQHLQTRPGQRNEVVASEIYPELPLLVCEGPQVCGQTYSQAQGVFALKAFPEHDGRVRLEVVPELHFGPMRQHWTGQQGMLRLETGQEHREFDTLAMSTILAPGQILVITGLPNRSGSLGYQFFTESKNGRLEQKILVVRLAQTQHNDLIGPAQALPLGEN